MQILRLIVLCLLFPLLIFGQPKPAFRVVPLGVLGGIDESNLSAYMAAPYNSNNYVCLDAGTLHYGIQKAIENHVFLSSVDMVLKQHIKGYLISHSHLDHLAGLVINSPEDTSKNIYALQNCISVFKTHYFTWQSWANFADEGEKPQLSKYHYITLTPAEPTKLINTDMQVQAFPLSHANLISTAFLLRSNADYLLYLGDTGADRVEKSQDMQKLWQAVAPLIKKHQLKGIMIEVSFPDEQPEKTLFGHLTPKLLMQEFNVLKTYTGAEALHGLNVIITHVKPPAQHIQQLKAELSAQNSLGLNLIFPQQGKAINL